MLMVPRAHVVLPWAGCRIVVADLRRDARGNIKGRARRAATARGQESERDCSTNLSHGQFHGRGVGKRPSRNARHFAGAIAEKDRRRTYSKAVQMTTVTNCPSISASYRRFGCPTDRV